jgi:hypothetical protein
LHCGAASEAGAGAAQVQCAGCGAILGGVASPPARAALTTCKPGRPRSRADHARGGLGPLFLAVVFGAGAACLLYRYITTAGWEYAEGDVVGLRIDGESNLFARVEFPAADGLHYRFEGSCPWGTKTGDSVGLFYLHGDPSQAKIDNDIFLVAGRAYLAGVGCACAVLCGMCLWWLLVRRVAPKPQPWDL